MRGARQVNRRPCVRTPRGSGQPGGAGLGTSCQALAGEGIPWAWARIAGTGARCRQCEGVITRAGADNARRRRPVPTPRQWPSSAPVPIVGAKGDGRHDTRGRTAAVPPDHRFPLGPTPRPFLVPHTREGIRQHRTAHKGRIKPLCAVPCFLIPSLVCDMGKRRAAHSQLGEPAP